MWVSLIAALSATVCGADYCCEHRSPSSTVDSVCNTFAVLIVVSILSPYIHCYGILLHTLSDCTAMQCFYSHTLFSALEYMSEFVICFVSLKRYLQPPSNGVVAVRRHGETEYFFRMPMFQV